MKRKTSLRILALVTALAGLFSGCRAAPETTEPTETTVSVQSELHVYCFQAGKADAFLLWTDQGAVLIDTGESGFGKTILAYMESQGIEKLDALIITHFDKDHVGGAKKILESIQVDRVLQSNFPKESSAYSKYLSALEAKGLLAETVSGDLTLTVGDVVFTVNGPTGVYAADASNNSSLIVSVCHGRNRLLFMGDAQEARMAEFIAANGTDYDMIKIPYHGHWQEGLAALLKSTTPEIAVIPSSDEEPEDEQTVDLLAQYRIETYLTREGPILLVSDSNGVTAQN